MHNINQLDFSLLFNSIACIVSLFLFGLHFSLFIIFFLIRSLTKTDSDLIDHGALGFFLRWLLMFGIGLKSIIRKFK